MAKRLVAACVLAAACGGGAKTPPPAALHITEQGVGSITAQTPATLDGVRAALPGYEVKKVDTPDGPELHVLQNGEDLLYVTAQTDGKTLLNVHVTSPRVESPWKLGEAFKGGAALTTCECWGPHADRPGHNVCYKKGDHVALGFERECRDENEELAEIVGELAGKPIKLIVWAPAAFGETANAPPVKDETPND